MIYDCFLDDSKDEKQEHTYVCAGFFAPRHAWNHFRSDWDKALKLEGIDYWKTSELKSLSGQFSRYASLANTGREGARLVKERLMRIVLKHRKIRGIGVAIPITVHKEVMSHPSASLIFSGNLYDRAFESVVLQAVRSIDDNGYINFAHDNGPDFERLRELYNSFARLNTTTSKTMGGFDPLDDKTNSPLQIADMLANSVMGRFRDQINGFSVSPLDVDFIQISNLFTWTTGYGLTVLKVNLERNGHPVPADLEHLNA